MGAAEGCGDALQVSCLDRFDTDGLHQDNGDVDKSGKVATFRPWSRESVLWVRIPPSPPELWRCGRVVYCSGLENRRARKGPVSSNLTVSARYRQPLDDGYLLVKSRRQHLCCQFFLESVLSGRNSVWSECRFWKPEARSGSRRFESCRPDRAFSQAAC